MRFTTPKGQVFEYNESDIDTLLYTSTSGLIAAPNNTLTITFTPDLQGMLMKSFLAKQTILAASGSGAISPSIHATFTLTGGNALSLPPGFTTTLAAANIKIAGFTFGPSQDKTLTSIYFPPGRAVSIAITSYTASLGTDTAVWDVMMEFVTLKA